MNENCDNYENIVKLENRTKASLHGRDYESLLNGNYEFLKNIKQSIYIKNQNLLKTNNLQNK